MFECCTIYTYYIQRCRFSFRIKKDKNYEQRTCVYFGSVFYKVKSVNFQESINRWIVLSSTVYEKTAQFNQKCVQCSQILQTGKKV